MNGFNVKRLLCPKAVIALLLALSLSAGCDSGGNSNTATLKGTVTVNGEPLPDDAEGYIQFMTTEPGQAQPSAATMTGSDYAAEDVPRGKLNVIFNITRLTGRMVKEDNAPGATPYPEREDLVPKKHRSGFQVDVTGDDDAFNFEL